MNNAFKQAVKELLRAEGGYVDHPSDPGGATNYGISLRWYKQAVDEDAEPYDIEQLSKGQAKSLYYRFFWSSDRHNISYDDLPQGVAYCLFFLAVNTGRPRAHRLLQKTLKKMGQNLKVDGLLGRRTKLASSAVDERELISRLSVETISFYLKLNKPEFQEGWIYRAVESSSLAREFLCQQQNCYKS